MDNQEFSSFRQKLQKTQKEMAALLGTSLKTVQSFEQGWRKIPVHIERQMLFLLNMKKGKANNARPCWDIHGTLVHVEDGIITNIVGNPDCPTNRGKICIRSISSIIGLYNPYRVKGFLKRPNPEKRPDIDPGWVSFRILAQDVEKSFPVAEGSCEY